MAVLLSPVGGVAGQFFDNNGNPLTGGKLYSYVAGTTIPQATYTSSAGTVAHSNPIILDAGGRVPGGEIWLTDGLQYKFVLKNASDVLIGTYDNIIGINSNFVNFLTETEVQTATAGQTVFTLTTMQYQPGTNNLSVFVDGVNQIDGSTYSYVETSSTVITFTAGLHVGALVKFTTAQTLSTGVTDASLVTYTPAGTGAVATTVQTKLRQTVSPEDFGAVGNGIADDTSAVQAAFDFAFANDLPIHASKIYLINGTLIINKSVVGFPPAFVFGGGTFKKNNAGTMFKGGNLYTGVLFFDNISFVANPAVNVIAFECAPDLIRTYFSQCSFQFFDVCFSGNSGTSTYIQTLRLVNCSFGQIKSWVIDTGDSATNTAPNGYVFDASIYGCSFEAFTTGGVCRAFPFRFSCKDSVIEDFVTKPAFYFNGAVATDICNNYTENIFGGFVEFKSTGLGVNGFSISNNLGWTTAGVPFIKWPPSLFANPVSINNNVNGAGPIHDTSLVTSGYVSSFNDYHVGFVANTGSALRTVPSQLRGEYTPVIAGETSAGVGTYNTQFGAYNIVGNTITVTVTLDWTAHTGTGNFYITLPTSPRTGVFVAQVAPISLTVPTGRVLSAATDFGGANRVFVGTLRTDGSGGGFDKLSLASYTSGSLSLTITYTT